METTTSKNINPHKAEIKAAARKTAKPLLYIGIVSIVMLFAGLTSAYVVRANSGNWLVFDLPRMAFVSTVIITLSSLTLFVAQRAIKKDNLKLTTIFIGITFILGLGFFFTQILAWKELTAQGIFFVGKYSNASGSFLYLIALVHLMHMIGGLIALLVSLTKSMLKKYSVSDYLGIELTAIYWHFLDLLWVYLFLFLYNYR